MAQINAHHKLVFHLKEGQLHKDMGVSKDKKIPAGSLEHEKAIATKTGNTTLEKRVQFAINARHFNHSHKGSQAGH